ncbi:MAG TPA: hypothetical protein VHG69_00855 [Thermoleophilaceae bacterium]|nr:hypothetical protein [Thermoleophilaceae bacterium]
MDEPTSWYAIAPGWEVVDRSGATVGDVIAVVGDEEADIFDGLRIETPGGDELFARGEQVEDIVEGRVALDANENELDASPPGGAEISRDRDAEL